MNRPGLARNPLLSGPRAVFALMLREMATTYGRSPGGYLWAIVDPLAGVILLTAVFSLAFHSPPLGTNFPLFYATGYLPFIAYAELTAKLGQAIRYSRPLLSYPAVTYIDAILSRMILNFLTNVLIFVIMVCGIALFYGLDIQLDPGRLAHALAMMAVLVLGIGTLNCYLFGAFPVWERIWSILNRPFFFISGVFFLVDKMDQGFRDIVLWNPLAHIVCEIRAGFFPMYEARYASPLYVYGFGLVCLFFGLLLLYRHSRYLITEGA